VFSSTGERDASVKLRDPAERERGCSGLPPSPWNEMVFEKLGCRRDEEHAKQCDFGAWNCHQQVPALTSTLAARYAAISVVLGFAHLLSKYPLPTPPGPAFAGDFSAHAFILNAGYRVLKTDCQAQASALSSDRIYLDKPFPAILYIRTKIFPSGR